MDRNNTKMLTLNTNKCSTVFRCYFYNQNKFLKIHYVESILHFILFKVNVVRDYYVDILYDLFAILFPMQLFSFPF